MPCCLPSVAAVENKQTNVSVSNYDANAQKNTFPGEKKPCTLCLHAGADQSQRVTGELAACARDSAAGEQDEHAGVHAAAAVVVQVVVFQRLPGTNQVNNIHISPGK